MEGNYVCAVVELAEGKFAVTPPEHVGFRVLGVHHDPRSKNNLNSPRACYTPILRVGPFTHLSHFLVSGDAENVGSVIQGLMSSAIAEKPITLDQIKDTLIQKDYSSGQSYYRPAQKIDSPPQENILRTLTPGEKARMSAEYSSIIAAAIAEKKIL